MMNNVANSDVINTNQRASINVLRKVITQMMPYYIPHLEKVPSVLEPTNDAIKEQKTNILFHFFKRLPVGKNHLAKRLF